ncbi:hypothetical protein FACS1894120_0660 [Clostridia bacterium]|nr:hypothetical protein FACS1894120_0660 [Clostridia bacterium]
MAGSLKPKRSKFHKATAVFLCLALLSGCGGSGSSGGSGAAGGGAGDSAGADATAETTEKAVGNTRQTQSHDALVAALEAKKELVDHTIEVKNKIRWMAWYDIDEAQPASELYKQVFGTPDDSGRIIEFVNTAYENRFTDLSRQVAAGTSPDMFPFEIANYPYSAYSGLFQPVDRLITLDNPLFDTTREYIKQFDWGGRLYVPINSIENSDVLWYRRSVIEDASLDDPYELYREGKWTWDAFLDMASKFSDPENSMYILDGWSPENSFAATTGVPLITLKDGKLQSNLNNGAIERGANLLTDMWKQKYPYPRAQNNYNINYDAWVKGKTLFFTDGDWRFEETWANYRDTFKWGDDEIMFVPYPKDPQSDKYYQLGKVNAFMLVSGAKNTNEYNAFIQCALATSSVVVMPEFREKRMKDYGWTEEQLDLLDEIKLDMTPVFDFKNGIGQDLADTSNHASDVESLLKLPYLDGTPSYTQIRAGVEGRINERLADLNASVS